MKSIDPLTLPAGPGATRIEDAPKRNPYDISTWGPGCGVAGSSTPITVW